MPCTQVRPRPCCPPRFPRFGQWLALLCASLVAALHAAEEPSRRRFDLPAGAAVITLKRAAQQAGLEIVYSAAVVQGVQTQPVAGEFTPREALERMVAHTPLKIFPDPQTGALSVLRASDPEPRQTLTPPPAKEPSRPMKPKSLITVLSGWFALALAPAHSTQAADGAPTAAQQTAAVTGRVQNVVTGQYLNNARVAVRGTDLVVFTDQSGTYRLNRVPGSGAVLEVSYTGLDSQQISLQLTPGQETTVNVDLTSVARYGDQTGVVKLDSFTVSSSRETDGAAIAINEQRFAANIKNVVAADSLGDVMDGNIGEFLKFVPGVTPEYDYEDGTTVSTVSIRGFAPHMVAVSTDGAQMANTSNALGDSRAFSFNQASINNISRIEIAKVPTPSNRADSLSGSVNMVSKSSFERKQMQFRYNLNLAANSENFDLRKTPHTTDKKIHKMKPGGNFDLTLPINSRFGLVMTGAATERYAKLHYSYKTYNSAGTGTGASVAKPFLQTYRLLDSPRTLVRQSIGLKADWKVTRHGVLSVGGQVSHFESTRIATEFTSGVGNIAAPTPATGVPFSFGDDYAIGATGRGSVTLGGATSTHIVTDATAGNIRYRYDNGTWKIMLAADKSRAQGGYRDQSEGHFRQMAISLRNPSRLEFRAINDVRPESLKIFDNTNREVDLYANSWSIRRAAVHRS